MNGRTIPGLLIVLFSLAVGHLAWNSVFGPPVQPDYPVGGKVDALTNPNTDSKQLYLRRELFLTQHPSHAWIQVVARDQIALYVNGVLIQERYDNGFTVAIVSDLTPLLKPGRNVIAMRVQQRSLHANPLAAVTVGYHLSDGEHRIDSQDGWRCASFFERNAHWWFEPYFDDRHWQVSHATTAWLRASLVSPPRAVTQPRIGRWITSVALEARTATVCREFEVGARPRQAWLRVTTDSTYRLAINGTLLDEQEGDLGTTLPWSPAQRIYDISTIVHGGKNLLCLSLTHKDGPPHLLADLEVEDNSGQRHHWGSDERWRCHRGRPGDWLFPDLQKPDATWDFCRAEPGNLDIMPWAPRRDTVAVSLPIQVVLRRFFMEGLLVAATVLLTALACKLAALILYGWRGLSGEALWRVVYVPLVPATAAIAAAVVSIYDPRIGPQDVYQDYWLLLALLSVPLQWILLGALVRHAGSVPRPAMVESGKRCRHLSLAGCLMCGLMLIGCWLRFGELDSEPLHPDEVTILYEAHGLWQRGLPSLQINQDTPTYYVSGCELEMIGAALSQLVFDKDTYIVRTVPACWGILTILLIYQVGRRLFCPLTGLIAAAIYTFSPPCILMSNFARYASLLQFATLLTIYFFCRTVAGQGPINRRALWFTALGFAIMFLTWEASAMVAPGMIVGALIHRRGRLKPLLGNLAVWVAMLLIIALILVQFGFGRLQSAQLFQYGTGWSDVKLTPMWLNPIYRPFRYIWESSWNRDALLPMLGLAGGVLLTIRHKYRRHARMLLAIQFVPCILMSALIPLTGSRYAYHLTPLVILLSAAALAAGTHFVARSSSRLNMPGCWRWYAYGVAGGTVGLFLALASGFTVELLELPTMMVSLRQRNLLYSPDFAGPIRFFRDHYRDGDVVIATFPEVVDHVASPRGTGALPEGWRSDLWLESTLQLPAVLDDRQSVPIHRWVGTTMVSSRASLRDVFAQHDRVWFFADPNLNAGYNDPDVSAFVRHHMDVVYEDYGSLLLLHDRHRPAAMRREHEMELQRTKAIILP